MMLLPSQDAERLLPLYLVEVRVLLAVAQVEGQGQVSIVTLTNTRFLNAEDDSTLDRSP
jgi:hypothetical protein